VGHQLINQVINNLMGATSIDRPVGTALNTPFGIKGWEDKFFFFNKEHLLIKKDDHYSLEAKRSLKEVEEIKKGKSSTQT
jgi:hypothetical protein